ncbi:MAG: hypothetical protein JWR35_2187 [Marmoricola sp.]|nr:hypothetical protein [Marmoricola sp.]
MSLQDLDFIDLTEARDTVLTALVSLCAEGPDPLTPLQTQRLVEGAVATLGLGPTQAEEVRRNGGLLTAPTARADKVYSGVLYDALDIASLEGPAKRRATRWLAITSSLFGLVRPNDPIPAYRLSGDVTLPDVGVVSAHWRKHLDPVVRDAAGNGLIIDLRSTMYAGFWRPSADTGARVATVRVLHQVGSERKVVSHFNKATKGRIVRDLLLDGGTPNTPPQLADHLAQLGWKVEVGPAKPTGQQLDVIIDAI